MEILQPPIFKLQLAFHFLTLKLVWRPPHFSHSEQLPNPGCSKRPTKYRMAYHQSLTSSRPSLCSSSILFLVFDMQYRLNNNGKSCIPNSIKSQPYLDVKYFKVFFFVFLNRAVPLSQRERYYSRAPGRASSDLGAMEDIVGKPLGLLGFGSIIEY